LVSTLNRVSKWEGRGKKRRADNPRKGLMH